MKKTIAFILAALMMLSLAACGANGSDKDTTPATTAPVTTAAPETEPAPTTVGTTLYAQFKTIADKTPQEISETLLTNEIIQFMGGAFPVEEGYLAGFNEEIKGFTEGYTFAPMIGTIPFVGYIFTVDGDVDAFVKTLEDNANLRWNICTEAEELIVEAEGNTVFFIMCPTTFEEAPAGDEGADIGGMEITPEDGMIPAEDGITLE